MWIAPLLALVAQHAPDADAHGLRGTIVISDERGQYFVRASGVLILRASGLHAHEHLVPFENGAFELDGETHWIDVYGAWTALGPVRIDALDRPVPDSEVLALVGYVVEPFSLHVLDPETAAPLDCVTVVSPMRAEGLRAFLSARDGASIEIGPLFGSAGFLFEDSWSGPRGDGEWTVRAPGRVERRLNLTRDSPRSNVAYLERAGSLELVLEQAPSTRHTYLELDSGDIGMVYRGHVDAGSTPYFEGLRPGPYVARVVHEFLDYRRVVLAEAHVEVRPDIVVSAKLVAAKPPPDDTDGPP